MIILSSSGGIFIIGKFTAYFVYKVRKVIRNSENEGVEKNSKTLGLLSKQLSTKDKKRKRLLVKDLLLRPANVWSS